MFIMYMFCANLYDIMCIQTCGYVCMYVGTLHLLHVCTCVDPWLLMLCMLAPSQPLQPEPSPFSLVLSRQLGLAVMDLDSDSGDRS